MTLTEFKHFPELPQYLRFHILLYVQTEDFPNIKYVNRELYELCSGKLSEEIRLRYGSQITDRLYHERAKSFILKQVYRIYDYSISWKEFYYSVLNCMKKRDIHTYITTGNLLKIKILFILFPLSYNKNSVIQTAISNGKVNILDWLLNSYPKLFENKRFSFIHAVIDYHFEVLNWAKEHKILYGDYSLSNMVCHYYVKNKTIEMLQWLKDNNIGLPTHHSINIAVQNNNVEVLNWIKNNTNLEITQYHANTAAGYGYINLLEWLKENNLPLPNEEGAEKAANYLQLETLKWMKENNLPIRVSNEFLLRGCKDAIKIQNWLHENKII